MVPSDDPDLASESCHTSQNRKHRKSVSFSLTAQTVLIDSKGNSEFIDVKIQDQSHKVPLSNVSNTSYHDKDQALLPSPRHPTNSGRTTAYAATLSIPFMPQSSLPPLYDTLPALSKKRPFSLLASHSLSHNDISHTQSSCDSPSSPPRKRSLSDVSQEKNISSSTHGYRGDRVYSALTQSEARAILRLPTSPSPDFCAEANRRIRSALNCPTFDFSQHILHRTYVVRNVQFSEEEECVVMLDAAVETLLPRTYPLLPPCSIYTVVVAPSREKGKGLFSQSTIRDLEVILSERPIIIVPYVIGLAVPLSQLYADIFHKLSEDVLDNLVDPTSIDDDDTPPNYEAIIRLNALAIALNVPDDQFAELPTHRGVFLQTGRCNHSCGPNAKWEWDQSTFSLVLTAVRQINPGEEITIAYVPPHLPYKVRESSLREIYGFACLCIFCSQAPEQIEKSDAARDMLTNFWRSATRTPKFETWCTDLSIPTDMLLNAHLNAINLITREGLHILDTRSISSSDRVRPQRDVGRHLDRIAMCYGAMEDVDNFRKWIQKALEARDNLTPEQRLAFKKWLSNPVSFPAWGWRKNSSKGSDYQHSRIMIDSTNFMPS